MITSQKSSIQSQIEGDDPIPVGTMAYICERARNNFYNFILTKFLEAEERGLTKAKLARRIGKTPDRVSHMLGAPGNWTIDTATELLLGISKEELLPASEPFLGRAPRNCRPSDLMTSRSELADSLGNSIVFDPDIDAAIQRSSGGRDNLLMTNM